MKTPNATGRIKKLLKEYFVFSTSERKGIIALIILLVFLISAPYIYEIIFPPKPFDISITELKSLDNENNFVSEVSSENNSKLFSFDPNTATDDELAQLGFSKFNIKTIRNYVSKGGKFHSQDDLKKIYGVKEELFEKVKSFIAIQNENKSKNVFSDSTKNQKKNQLKKVVEINTADSAELVALYRIGPAIAMRIIDYRNKLGGFLNLEQLKEIWGFDEDVLYDLQGKISVDASKAKILDINKVTADDLKMHPYFKFKLSSAIVNYRKQHGSFKNLEDLKKIVLVNDSIFQRIIPYLKIN